MYLSIMQYEIHLPTLHSFPLHFLKGDFVGAQCDRFRPIGLQWSIEAHPIKITLLSHEKKKKKLIFLFKV